MSTPSPSKRPRYARMSSAVGSPYTFLPSHMAANKPTPPMPLASLAAFSAMSPVESFSPFNNTSSNLGTGIGLGTAFGTPYANGSAANSPISTALFHGSKVLSNIQPSNSQLASSRSLASESAVPQLGSPKHLRLALEHLQTTLLATLEAEAEAYFDAVDTALSTQSDSRTVYNKAQAFDSALQGVLSHLEKQGLAYVPMLPLSSTNKASSTDKGDEDQMSATAPIPDISEGASTINASTTQELAPLTLAQQTQMLQQEAKQLYARRQRLKESAGIVAGILSD